LNKEEGEEFVPWIMGLAEKGMGAEIIEYDSVVNQMLVWCFMNNLPATNPIYKSLESMASDERDRRASGLASPPLRTPIEKPVKIETVQNNLPKLQGVKAVGSPKMVSGPKPVH
jgi:hypothetical protein